MALEAVIFQSRTIQSNKSTRLSSAFLSSYLLRPDPVKYEKRVAAFLFQTMDNVAYRSTSAGIAFHFAMITVRREKAIYCCILNLARDW